MSFLDLLFPKQCLHCRREGRYLCLDCISSVPQVKQRCIVCQRPVIDGYTHASCRGKYTIDRMIALYPYKSVVGKAIRSLKYKFASDVVKELAEYSLETIKQRHPEFVSGSVFILIPIPMHWKRKNWRGFNQTEVIGELISKKLGLGYQPNLLIRTVQPKAQEGLKKEERIINVSNVFSLHHSSILNPESCYILFDDVLTTGSTLSEAGKILKKAGAKKVWAVTVAR